MQIIFKVDLIPDYASLFYFGAAHVAVGAAFVCSIMLFVKRKECDWAGFIFTTTILCFCSFIILRILVYFFGVNPESLGLLPVETLLLGFFLATFCLLYPIAIRQPRWVSPKIVAIWFIPVILYCVVYLLLSHFGVTFHQINTHEELFSRLDFDILFRLSIIVAVVVMNLLILAIPIHATCSRSDVMLTRVCVASFFIMAILWSSRLLIGWSAIGIVHQFYIAFLIAAATYYELYVRRVKVKEQIALASKSSLTSTQSETNAQASRMLQERLCELMQTQQPWRSPNITISEVAKSIQSNRTTLAIEIQSMGYGSFHDLVAKYRVEALCETLKTNKGIPVGDALIAVGFRSRTAAYERFKRHTGMTPAEYSKAHQIIQES